MKGRTCICLIAACAAVVALIAPASASAANLFASPTGTAIDDCTNSGAPCSLERAVNTVSESGDDITLLDGTYTTSTTIGGGGAFNRTIHGAPGARPTINFTASSGGQNGIVLQAGSVIRDVVIESAAGSGGSALFMGGGTVERVSVHESGSHVSGSNTRACAFNPGTVMRDSVCWYSGAGGSSATAIQPQSLFPDGTGTLRNVTAIAANAPAIRVVAAFNTSGPAEMDLTATNVIARGGGAAGQEDVQTTVGGGALRATATLDHSNYATESEAAPADITDPGSGTNVTAAPAFVNAGTGDFHQLGTSTGTLNLGTATGQDPLERDIDGQAREMGSAPDIGADEFNYTVNTTADTGDATPDGACDDGSGNCTLREAIQESNSSTTVDDAISFASTPFDGTAANGTIAVATNLPSIADAVTIEGGDCDSTASFKPCAGIEGSGAVVGLDVATGGDGSDIRNLAFSNLTIGISLGGGDNVEVTGSWFGIDLDESTAANLNVQGISISSTSLSNQIGDGTVAGRNLFARNTQAGVLIQAADNNTIVGNYFGTNRAGASPGGGFVNGDAIHIHGFSAGPNTAAGNVIGGPDTAGNSACDGECNLIANVTDDAIDLSDDFPPDTATWIPADSSTISGNYIGLAADGTDGNFATDSSGNNGIEFSASSEAASNTIVGGTSAADRNYIGGNPVGIDTGEVTDTTTTIQNNYLGVQPDGTGHVSNTLDTLLVSGAGAGSVKVLDNRIGGDSALPGLEGISAYGANTVIRGNTIGVDTAGAVIGFAGSAIETQPSTSNLTIGGTGAGQGNVIAGGTVAGIRLEGASLTTIQGNFVGTDATGTTSLPNAGPGILATFSGLDDEARTTIGGTAAAGENVISNNGGDAIRVTQVTGVEIQRNRGSGNGQQFIDLENPPGSGNNVADGSAEGLQAPQITDFDSLTQVSGAAQPNATIRLFTKSSDVPGELGTQIATTTATGTGSWTAIFSAQPEGQRVVALQTVPTTTGPPGFHSSELSSVVHLETAPVTTPPALAPPVTTPPTPKKKKCKKGFVKKKVKGKKKCVKKKKRK